MSDRKQRLELTWIGKYERPRLEPRILLEDPGKSYHAQVRVTDHDIFDNILIQGDNLLALKALEQEYTGRIKCIFIDPPYNTGSAFEHYDDGVEHSVWLGLMRDRLELLRRLLMDDGSLWITIDDNEAHYLKVLCDEVFGRSNFIANVIWEKSDSPKMDSQFFSSRHDHLFVFAKNRETVRLSRLAADAQEHYNKVTPDGRRYYTKPLRAMGSGEDTREARPSMYFKLTAPDGTEVYPKKPDGSDGRWRWGPEKYANEISRIEWVNGRNGWTPYFRIYEETGTGRPPETIWSHSEVGSNRTSKAEVKALFGENDLFTTPKPEALISRVLQIATTSGDLVLDSFGGSGTTGAVAHKMGRRWIMVELHDHCYTHIVPRLQKVIDGSDAGGVTEALGWKGGGGFRYYRLAPSLLEKDAWGNWVISKDFDPAKLSQAVCKLMGFVYAPSDMHYWMHGRSSETDFIYVTTQNLTHQQLAAISEDVGDKRTLLVCCKAFRSDTEQFSNLTIRKIPQAVLRKCEWGHDDYSLNVSNLPMIEALPEARVESNGPSKPAKAGRKRAKGVGVSSGDLFSEGSAK
jgi:adenine-specific DNA-methyltransferase